MKKTIAALILTLIFLTAVAFSQTPTPTPPLCRGTQEIDQFGNPVPDDPNCIVDPSIGGNGGGIFGDIGGFFCPFCE